MAYRRYRRSRGKGLTDDVSFIANRLSWEGAIVLGMMLYILFYWLLPLWLNYYLSSKQGSLLYPMLEAVFGRRIHWFQWLGIACGLLGIFYAIRNYFSSSCLDSSQERDASLISRILARFID